MKKILITGCGSLIGQGLIKTMKDSSRKYNIYGTDYIKDTIGHHIVKRSFILPDILKKNCEKIWLKKLIGILKKNKINYLIPGLDFELKHLSQNKKQIEKKTRCKVIVSKIDIIKTFNDKWLTVQYLKNNKFPYPKSCLPQNLNKFLKKNKFPLVVKPRFGSTSKNVFFVKTAYELKQAIERCNKPIIQENLQRNNNEYTCGALFNSDTGALLNTITLNRKLKNGNTVIAIHKKNKNFKKINEFIKKIVNKIKPNGPINLQLCLTKKGPVIFEINPRFSGTTPLRNIFGINEIDTLISSKEGKKNKSKKLKFGTVFRYYEDLLIKKK